jgi:hypothetical protein
MKITAFLFIVFLLLSGCGKSDSANTSSANTVSPTPVEQKTVGVKKKTNLVFKEVIWETKEFKFLFPCDLAKTPERRTISDNEESETQVCRADDLKFSVTSKKSKNSLREEFDKIKKENQVEENGVGKIIAIDYKRQTKTEKTTQSVNAPTSNEIKFELSEHRLHLVNDRWLIDLEIYCSSDNEKYCNDLMIAQADENINPFINSLKVIK